MIIDYSNVELTLDNNTINHVTQFKLLGVWLDNNPTFTMDSTKLRSPRNSYKYLLPKIKPLCNPTTLQIIHMVHVYNKLNYCSLVLGTLISQAESNNIKV